MMPMYNRIIDLYIDLLCLKTNVNQEDGIITTRIPIDIYYEYVKYFFINVEEGVITFVGSNGTWHCDHIQIENHIYRNKNR